MILKVGINAFYAAAAFLQPHGATNASPISPAKRKNCI